MLLNEQDAKVVQMIADMFIFSTGDLESEKTATNIAYGRGLLRTRKRSAKALMWAGYYLGFGAGCRFMRTEQGEG